MHGHYDDFPYYPEPPKETVFPPEESEGGSPQEKEMSRWSEMLLQALERRDEREVDGAIERVGTCIGPLVPEELRDDIFVILRYAARQRQKEREAR